MKNKIIYIFLIFASLNWLACEPEEIEPQSAGEAPSESSLDFSVAQGDDEFHYVFTNNSNVTGIAHWDFGNGVKETGDVITVYYPLADDYTVKLTLVTSGGSANIEKTHTTTETDYSIFSDPVYVMLSGGPDAPNGKTWVIDSTEVGHFGIGPAGGNWPEWWAAASLQKTEGGAYDDEFNFNLNGFVFTYINPNNDSYVKEYQKDLEFYTNPIALYGEPDCRVTYEPEPGTWSIIEKEDGNYINLAGPTPLFFGFDYGGAREYRIETLEKNLMKLSVIGGDGNRWHYQLIPKGYVKPTITCDITNAATANENEFEFSLTNVVIPEGLAIKSVSYDFGDGAKMEVEDYTQKVTHTYMRKGKYMVTAIVHGSNEDLTKTTNVEVTKHHSTYTEYILDAMVMYNDFGETTTFDVLGENCAVSVVANPDKSMYPNRSNNCAFYSKTAQQWANAYAKLPAGYRFDLRQQSTFKILVYGKAGDEVLLKLENTDRGGNAWQTGTYDLKYTIQKDNTWEIAEFNFAGVGAGWDWTGDIFTGDVTTSDDFNHDFYNIVRIMLNPGVGDGTHEFYFDALAGPHVEGLK